ncbi:MAG: AbrB family transcriptional regulator [Pseudomonadota bacterium]
MNIKTALLFLCGFVGGEAAYFLGLPMPFLLGSLVGAALFIFFYETDSRKFGKLHPYVRMAFVAITGTMIGSTFTPDLLDILPLFWISALAIIPFMFVAHAGSYWIMRRIGKYDVTTAYWASLPGGLVEAVLLGEKEGADVRILTVQHFLRILIIVITVPFGFLIMTGEAVGSAAGESFGSTSWDFYDVPVILVIAIVGAVVGRGIKLPAGHLMGPMLLALGLAISGAYQISNPPWLLAFAQLAIGAALGSQFSGITRRMLITSVEMGGLAVAYMLLVAVAFAGGLYALVPADFVAMFISFAAGGLAEMSLIALSLNLAPVIVALHHLFRIFVTVWLGNLVFQRFVKPGLNEEAS